MRKALMLLLGFMIVLALTSCTEKPDIVVFTDSVLEAKVRDYLDIPEGDISVTEAATVEVLELSIDWDLSIPNEEKIQDISALAYFSNLQLLEIQFHAISDISPLAGLTQLHSLSLGGNLIKDISSLSNLKELRFLTIFNCEASDYSPLKELSFLQTLFISWSTFEDLSVLTDLQDLNQLYIDNTLVSDLRPIANLDLKALRLKDSKVVDYSPIEAMYPNLKEKDFEIPN